VKRLNAREGVEPDDDTGKSEEKEEGPAAGPSAVDARVITSNTVRGLVRLEIESV
jgi:hypothetical protein